MTSAERTPSRSRLRRRALIVLAVLGSLAAFVGWGDRSETTIHSLGGSEILIVNVAGPVTVRGADGLTTPAVAVHESWLFSRPEVVVETVGARSVVRARCAGRGPCRSSIEVNVPGTADLVVVATGAVTVTTFDGELSVLSSGADVALGPVSGSLRAVAAGRIDGWGLLGGQVELSAAGPVVVDFAAAPESLVIDGGADVSLALPDEVYFVAGEVAGERTSELEESDDAPARLVVDVGGDLDLYVGEGR